MNEITEKLLSTMLPGLKLAGTQVLELGVELVNVALYHSISSFLVSLAPLVLIVIIKKLADSYCKAERLHIQANTEYQIAHVTEVLIGKDKIAEEVARRKYLGAKQLVEFEFGRSLVYSIMTIVVSYFFCYKIINKFG